MNLNFKAPLAGLFLICSQSVGSSYMEDGVPTVVPLVEYKSVAGKHNQQVDRLDYTSTMVVSQKSRGEKNPIPYPKPQPAPAGPRS